MALLFMDGFATNDITTKWNGGALVNTGSSNPRTTGGSWAQLGNLVKNFSASSRVITGVGAYHAGPGIALLFWGDAATINHITVQRNGSGYMEIRRGGTGGTVLATGTTFIPSNQWVYVEASVTVSDTVGEVHVRLNGLGTDEVSYTGDTKNGGTNDSIDRIHFWTTTGAAGTLATDFYICDGTGTAPNNDFLGDVAVRTLVPNGNGNSSQLVGSDGNSTDNYLLVDERPFSAADYAGSATTNNKDTYALTDLPASATTVYGVQVNASMLKSDAGVGQSRIVVRAGGTDYGGTTRGLSTSASTYHELYEQNPNTSAAWTPTNVNDLEAGMEVM